MPCAGALGGEEGLKSSLSSTWQTTGGGPGPVSQRKWRLPRRGTCFQLAFFPNLRKC